MNIHQPVPFFCLFQSYDLLSSPVWEFKNLPGTQAEKQHIAAYREHQVGGVDKITGEADLADVCAAPFKGVLADLKG